MLLPAHKSPITLAAAINFPCFINASSPRSRLSDSPLLKLLEQHHDGSWSGPVGQAVDDRRRLPGDDVLGRRARGVDPPSPCLALRMVSQRKLEVQRFPVGIEDQVYE